MRTLRYTIRAFSGQGAIPYRREVLSISPRAFVIKSAVIKISVLRTILKQSQQIWCKSKADSKSLDERE